MLITSKNIIYYVGEVKSIHLNELKKEFPWLTNDELKDIAGQSVSNNGFYSRSTSNVNQDDSNTVQVLYFNYKTFTNEVYKVKETATGASKLIPKTDEFNPPPELYEEYGIEKLSQSLEVLYEGVKIVGGKMLKWELAKNMIRPKSDYSKVKMNYSIVAPRMYQGRIESIVSRITGFADMIQLTHLKLQQVMSRMVPDGVYLDADGSTNNDRYITTVANPTGAQTGFSHSTLTYNPSTETLNVTNLVVSGTTSTINTEEINLADNIILLNSDYAGSSPTEDAGIEVERGTVDSNVSLIWDENANRWAFTNDGTTFYNIPISSEYNNYTHPTQSAISSDNSGVTFIQDIVVNTLGHVTSVGTGTVPDASTTTKGIIEIATQTEVNTGTDATIAVTPATLSTYVGNQVNAISFQVALDAAESSVTKSTNTYTVTHGLASQNLIVQVMDRTNYATVHVDVTRPNTSTIQVSFAAAVTDGDYHVMITKVA